MAIVVATFFFPPLLALVSLVLGLATFGKSLGIRRRYVRFLVQVFEWGARIKRAKERQQSAHSSQAPSDAESEEDCTDSYLPRSRAGSSSQPQLIQREATPQILKALQGGQTVTKEEKVWAIVNDSLDFIKSGMETIIEDEVTSRFSAEELASWNMLSRTSVGIQFLSYRLTFVWVLGFLFRYFILLPVRLLILSVGLTFLVVTTAVVGYFPPGPLKKRLNSAVSLMSYRILCRSISAIISFHHAENQARPGGICVANHTSPIDVIILSNDNCYALVGQKHGGLLGLVQRALSRAASHIWFERSVAADRAAVAARLRAHVRNLNNLPILIFPEGTCINNTSVMQFKKGAFEGLRRRLSRRHQVRPPIRRPVLEQREAERGGVPRDDDDELGHRRRRLVPAAHAAPRRRGRHLLRQPRQERHRAQGRPRRSRVGRTTQAPSRLPEDDPATAQALLAAFQLP